MVAVWIVPITQGALLGTVSMINGPARQYYRISCLFGTMPDAVNIYHVELQRAGRPGWELLDETAYFQMQPFGHRSRFDRLMEHWGARNSRVRRDFAEWLARRDREQNPARAPITRVRFLVTRRPIRADAPPQGRFQKPARPQRDRERVRVLATQRVGEGPG